MNPRHCSKRIGLDAGAWRSRVPPWQDSWTFGFIAHVRVMCAYLWSAPFSIFFPSLISLKKTEYPRGMKTPRSTTCLKGTNVMAERFIQEYPVSLDKGNRALGTRLGQQLFLFLAVPQRVVQNRPIPWDMQWLYLSWQSCLKRAHSWLTEIIEMNGYRFASTHDIITPLF